VKTTRVSPFVLTRVSMVFAFYLILVNVIKDLEEKTVLNFVNRELGVLDVREHVHVKMEPHVTQRQETALVHQGTKEHSVTQCAPLANME